WLHMGAGLSGRHKGKDSLWVSVTSPLQEGRKVGILQRNPDLLDDLPTSRQIAAFERCLSLVTRGEVGDEGHDFCQPLLDRPISHDRRRLSERAAGAH